MLNLEFKLPNRESKVLWMALTVAPSLAGVILSVALGSVFPPVFQAFLLFLPTLYLWFLFTLGFLREKYFSGEYVLMGFMGLVTLIHGFYFEGLILMLLYSLAELIEGAAEWYARRRLDTLYRLVPSKTLVDKGGLIESVDVSKLRLGDIVVVRVGEGVPADGVSVSSGLVNTSLVTGEPYPVVVNPGDFVASGYINVGGAPLKVRVLRSPSESTLQRVIRLAMEALEEKGRVERVVERLMKPWVVVALSSFALAYMILGPLRAVSILVVACPSAFIITSAFTTAYSIAALAGKGVVVRGGSVLEKVSEVDTIVLDKTGTITIIGSLEVSKIKPPTGLGEEEFKVLTASLAAASAHPISRALAQMSKTRVSVKNIVEVPGRGVKGVVDGLEVIIGNREMILDHGLKAYGECGEEEAIVYVAVNGSTGHLCLRESLDPAASRMLKTGGYKLIIASGDREHRVKAVAEALKIEKYYSNLSPEDKIALVRNLKSKGSKVMVVGDGVNDVAAMAASDAGVAVGNIDAVISIADSVLLNGVKQLPLLLGTAKTYTKTLKTALVTTVIIKAIALTGGLTGTMPLWLVALLGDDGATITGLLASITMSSLAPKLQIREAGKPNKHLNQAKNWQVLL